MNTAKKKLSGRTPRPSSNTTLLDLIIRINTEKINIETFQQLNTLNYMQVVCKRYAKHGKPIPALST